MALDLARYPRALPGTCEVRRLRDYSARATRAGLPAKRIRQMASYSAWAAGQAAIQSSADYASTNHVCDGLPPTLSVTTPNNCVLATAIDAPNVRTRDHAVHFQRLLYASSAILSSSHPSSTSYSIGACYDPLSYAVGRWLIDLYSV